MFKRLNMQTCRSTTAGWNSKKFFMSHLVCKAGSFFFCCTIILSITLCNLTRGRAANKEQLHCANQQCGRHRCRPNKFYFLKFKHSLPFCSTINKCLVALNGHCLIHLYLRSYKRKGENRATEHDANSVLKQ